MVRQAFQMDITYILTTTGTAKLKRYYEHIFGVTAIFRASTPIQYTNSAKEI